MAASKLIATRRPRGISLVEVLVGIAIGLIGTVAIFQAVAVWSKHTATASSGGDAQVSGTLALFNIERDLKQAGHGFGRAPTQVMGCNVVASDSARVPTDISFPLRPVSIATSGPAGSPDTLRVLYGNSAFFVDQGTFNDASASTKKLARRGGFKPGDLAVVAVTPGASAPSDCQLIQITANNDPDGYTVGHATTPFVSYYAASGASATISRYNSAAAPAGTVGTIYNLGPEPSLNVWSITNNRALTRQDNIQNGTVVEVADGVINLKAEYGIDADGNGRIDDSEWTTAAPADWRRVLAVRVAVLVRSRQFERNGDAGAASGVQAVTTANPYYFGDPVGHAFRMTNVDGSDDSFGPTNADPNNWRFYRYRVYERVIPLRNMLWGTWG